jgi:hypothetical protein
MPRSFETDQELYAHALKHQQEQAGYMRDLARQFFGALTSLGFYIMGGKDGKTRMHLSLYEDGLNDDHLLSFHEEMMSDRFNPEAGAPDMEMLFSFMRDWGFGVYYPGQVDLLDTSVKFDNCEEVHKKLADDICAAVKEYC